MRLRRLESRIVALFLVLIMVVQLGSFFAIQSGIQKNARSAISDQLAIGERVFQRLLEQNGQKLTQGARLLAADYGFRTAIASNDDQTIGSALSNHGGRMGATVALMVDTERRIKASSPHEPSERLRHSILQLVEAAELNGSASGTTLVKHRPYQVVAVPIKAPLIIGWIVMAFPIDQRLADDMRALTSLQVTMLHKDEQGHWQAGVSTLPEGQPQLLAQSLGPDPGAQEADNIGIGGEDYGMRVLSLAREDGQDAVVVLQRSVSETVAPYQRLQITLLVLTVLGIVLALAGSIVTAKRITGPLRHLGEIAQRLGRGEYEGPIAMKGDDEILALSQAFESMRDGIARREQEIRRLAYWDTLTGLPNRAQFVDVLKGAIATAEREGGSCFVLMMDMDRFKHVNDVLGHSYGDRLLRQLAARLSQQIRSQVDIVARLGGDEFAVLLHRAGIEDANEAAIRIQAAFEAPVELDDQTVDIGAGIGIAGYPMHGSDAEILLSRAEVAMYAAKESSEGAVVYDAAFDQGSQASLSMLSELRQAIERSELQLHVQPKVRLGSGSVVGAEALVRWVHPERGNIYPDQFIPFAEKTGFIRVITRWMLEQAAALCQSLEAQNVHLKISVNLSTRDLLDQELPAKLLEVLHRYQVAASSFCLEITESAIMGDPVRALQTLERLHALGVELSIDDFGTGYSSLAYLKRLPVDELKIDKSFVLNMAHDANDTKIVRSTIDLGHNMGLRVVAEGIENHEAWTLLEKLGCDQGQGYFMSRPMPAAHLAGWIAGWQPPVPGDELGVGATV